MQCVRACQATSGCTHFVFNELNECWKKRGSVSKENAFLITSSNGFCGIISNIVKSKPYIFCSNYSIPLFYEKVQSPLIGTWMSWFASDNRDLKYSSKVKIFWQKNIFDSCTARQDHFGKIKKFECLLFLNG